MPDMRSRLAWGPRHGPSTKQMNVDMIDGLAAILPGVDDRAVALGQPFGARNLCRSPVQMSEETVVLFLGVGDGGNVLAGHDENVHRCLRLDIRKSVALVVLVDRLGRNGSIDDLAENAAHD